MTVATGAGLAEAVVARGDELVSLASRFLPLREAVDSQENLSLSQWILLYTLVVEFSPDLVIELGRAYGNSTCVLVEAANRLGNTRVASFGYDHEQGWTTRTRPRLESIVEPDWFECLEVVHGDILEIDFRPVVESGQRVLLWWDAHGGTLGQFVLGAIVPQIAQRTGLVAVHDVHDARYEANPERRYVRSDGFPTFWHGHLSSPFEEIGPIDDFVSRNDIAPTTAAEVAARGREIAGWTALRDRLEAVTEPGVLDGGGWMFFPVDAGTRYFPEPPDAPRDSITGAEPRPSAQTPEPPARGFVRRLRTHLRS